MKRYILTIDEGTTSLRAVLYDVRKKRIVRFSRAYTHLIRRKYDWVEQNAEAIWNKTLNCLKNVAQDIEIDSIYGLGIANQRETIVAWDRDTGKPLYNAISWKCRRTAEYCKKLKESAFAKTIQEKTGLIVNSYFSATKIKWLLENVPAVKRALKKKKLCVGTIDSYLTFRLTDGKYFVTDVTNASRTMLFNIHTLKWDDEILKHFRIPKSILPAPVDNDKKIGYTTLLGGAITIAGLIGDQQSSLLGQGCLNKGDVKNTYGTGCFMLANIGMEPVISKHNLLTTIALRIFKQTSYALEGSIFSGGSIINKAIKDGIAKNHRRLTKMACRAKESDVYLIPAYNGMGAPYWLMDAQATYVNRTEDTTNKELARAAWQSIALRNYDVYQAMIKDLKATPTQLCVDGGLSKNKYLMRLQSNLLQLPISIINLESTCMGSIICTGLATNAFRSPYDLDFHAIKTFRPKKKIEEMQPLIDGWKKAIRKFIKGKK